MFKTRTPATIATMVTSVFAILTSVSTANAGPGGSGGGGSFVCRDSNSGKILNAELVDVWEARALDGRQIRYSNQDYWQQALTQVHRFAAIDEDLHRRMLETFEFIRKNIFFVPEGVSVPAPSDAAPGYFKTGCQLEGMMYFDGSRNRLAIQKETFDALLTETDKAAAIFHEVIYKVMRDLRPQEDSSQARRLTGCMFSVDASDCIDERPALEKIPQGVAIEICEATDPATQLATRYYQWPSSTFGVTNKVVDMIAGLSIPAGLIAVNQSQTHALLFHLGLLTDRSRMDFMAQMNTASMDSTLSMDKNSYKREFEAATRGPGVTWGATPVCRPFSR